MKLSNRPVLENSLAFYCIVCTLMKTVQGLSYSSRVSKELYTIDVFFSLEIELQCEFKIPVLGQKLEFPLGNTWMTSIGLPLAIETKLTSSLNHSVITYTSMITIANTMA